jgi:diguanylate cyclase (GGDEF)-like protein
LISLKKYLDLDGSQSDELLTIVLEAYRATMVAVGKSGLRACPTVSSDLETKLGQLQSRLSGKVTASLVTKTQQQIEAQLQQWAGATAEYYKGKADEVKELLVLIANTAESLGERDQRYSNQISQFTNRLQTIANLDDLTEVRASLVKGASELKTYVDKMTQDSNKSVAQLRAEVSTYERRLKEVEQLALMDSLTGLANRRYVEDRIMWRIMREQVFCIFILDLNGFKPINDTHGHLAGDALLKQFAQELRSNFRPTDIVGRWGGDEFIAVVDCAYSDAKAKIERLQKWVFGDYLLELPPGAQEAKIKVKLDASIGLAQWQHTQTMEQVIQAADTAMYRDKASVKKARA